MSTQLQCSACGAFATVPCDCHAPYIMPRDRAAQAIAEHPELSDRAIASMIGVGNKTVSRARAATVSGDTVRTGLDGKERDVRRVAVQVTHDEPETRQIPYYRVGEERPLVAQRFVAVPLPTAPEGLVGKATLCEQDMADLVAIGVRSVISVLPKELRSDQRNEARRRIAEQLLQMDVLQ